jgi:citrate lyase subunit beta/citryl-CoA lyase
MTNLDATQLVAYATTLLFVPGDRPDRFAKAANSGADLVILDLEDAVASQLKSDALAHVVAALTSSHADIPGGILRCVVRVNNVPALLGPELDALRTVASNSNGALVGIMLPKAENAHAIADVISVVDGVPVIPLIETALGLVNANEIAAVPGVARLAFGAVDFGRDLDATEPAVFDFARTQIVIASRAAGLVGPIDSPCVSIDDNAVILAESTRARDFGFTGKMCIHPGQCTNVAKGFVLTPEQVEWARKVVKLEGSATKLDGQMIDKPIVARAKRILERAKEYLE